MRPKSLTWCDTSCTADNIALLIVSERELRRGKEEHCSVLKLRVWNAGLILLFVLLVSRLTCIVWTPCNSAVSSKCNVLNFWVRLCPECCSSNHCRKQFTRFITHWFYWPLPAASLISISYIRVLVLPTPHEGSGYQIALYRVKWRSINSKQWWEWDVLDVRSICIALSRLMSLCGLVRQFLLMAAL